MLEAKNYLNKIFKQQNDNPCSFALLGHMDILKEFLHYGPLFMSQNEWLLLLQIPVVLIAM